MSQQNTSELSTQKLLEQIARDAVQVNAMMGQAAAEYSRRFLAKMDAEFCRDAKQETWRDREPMP